MLDKTTETDNKSGQPSHRYLIGKIARLPNKIREQLNRRLLDHQPATAILLWLNGLSPVRRILKAKFSESPIKRQNIDSWRRTGYQIWLKQEQSFLQLHRVAREARSASHAGCRDLARGTAAIVSSRLFQLVQSTASDKYTLDDFRKIVASIKPILTTEQNHTRIKHSKERIRQREVQLLLMRDKIQRDVISISFRLMHDELANQIAAAPIDHAQKIELLGLHMFGHLWEPRPIPTPGSPESPVIPAHQPAA